MSNSKKKANRPKAKTKRSTQGKAKAKNINAKTKSAKKAKVAVPRFLDAYCRCIGIKQDARSGHLKYIYVFKDAKQNVLPLAPFNTFLDTTFINPTNDRWKSAKWDPHDKSTNAVKKTNTLKFWSFPDETDGICGFRFDQTHDMRLKKSK